MSSTRARYGIDAPGVVFRFALFAVLGLGGGRALLGVHRLHGFGRPLIIMGTWFGITALVMLWSSLSGKFAMRDRMLDAIPWRGDERVLDAGCGHGLMLIGAAKRLTGGHATGIDLWSTTDQAGNSREATMQNVTIEGVSDRVEIQDGDVRKLPFEDASFDVVLSSFVIHNIGEREGREQAIAEIARVTKPGGYVAIADIMQGFAYRRQLLALGFTVVQSRFSLLFALPTVAFVMRKR
jgi:arsenite methyltransferase